MEKVYIGDALYLSEDCKCYYITDIIENNGRHLLCLTDGRYVYGEDVYDEEIEYINKKRYEKDDSNSSNTVEQAIQNQINDVLNEVDYLTIKSVMIYLDWKWASWRDSKGNLHTNEVPDEYALEKQAEELLWNAVKGSGSCAVGGFEASCGGVYYNMPTNEYLFDLKISFVLESFPGYLAYTER